MFNWLRKLNLIVIGYDADLRSAHARISDLEKIVRDRTNIAVDVGFMSANHVIVVGRYKNADYIQTFTLNTSDLTSLIALLRNMERYGKICRIDAPPTFRTVFERDQ